MAPEGGILQQPDPYGRIRVVICPDSFKGTIAAKDAARYIADGWRGVRPSDDLALLPQADGGEGTIDALEMSVRESPSTSVRHVVGGVTGPDGRDTAGEWLELADAVAVVELATVSGLPLMLHPDPLHAATTGVGQMIAAALDAGMRRVILGLGGSASTDGGAGALTALGAVLADGSGAPVGPGGAGLVALARTDWSALRPPPPAGIVVLADVESPLLGEHGAAAVFGPQKGATAADVALLDAGLSRFASLTGGNPDAPGAGAAGGTAFGFSSIWGATIESGADFVARATGLDRAIAAADLVITGEGFFDSTSFAGKVVGRILRKTASAGTNCVVIAGGASDEARHAAAALNVRVRSLSEIAGSTASAMADPRAALIEAGRRAAHAYPRELSER